jgi:hypothetical protein
MDFADQLKALAAGVPDRLNHIATEEAAKTSLVMPFLQIMGYNVFDPTEVMPEFDANVGAAKKYKLDYAILQDGKPIILIECKKPGEKLDDAFSQLFHYFSATEARIGVLTDGVSYRFYADLEKNHKMDDCPFLELDLLNLSDPLIPELKKLTKSGFNLEDAISTATVLKYTGGIKAILRQQLAAPEDDFVKFFFKQLCPNNPFTGKLKESFIEFTQKSFEEFIREELATLLDEVRKPKAHTSSPVADEVLSTPEPTEGEMEGASNIVTTEEELQGFYILKAILCNTVDSSRVAYRDTKSYFNILLDDNKLKPICRLYLNTSNWRLGYYVGSEEGKQEEKVAIQGLDDLYQYADQFKAIIRFYEQDQSDN